MIVTRIVAKLLKDGGPERDRTAGLLVANEALSQLVANEALSQLSYRPINDGL